MTGSENMEVSARMIPMENRELEPIEGAPLPLSEAKENPPLVVDLPEGQKLVVGNLDPGVVIEVATWRGTGRPDSRTSRLMLGVSTNEDEGIPKSRALPQVEKHSMQVSEDLNQPKTVESEQIKTGVIYSNLNPTRPSSELAVRETAKEKKKNILRLALIGSGAVASIAAISLVAFGFLGLRFAHPQTGVNTSTGPANTALALIRPASKIEVGKSYIADLASASDNPTMSVASAVNGSEVLLSTETGYTQVNSRNIRGKVVVLFPFFGAIANLF